MERREIIKAGVLSLAATTIVSSISHNANQSPTPTFRLKGNVKHSACKWCYDSIPLEQFIDEAKDIGLNSIELLDPNDAKLVIDKGLDCAIGNGSPLHITKGFNNSIYHAQLLNDYKKLIPQFANLGVKKVICFSGNRDGISDQDGLEQCAIGLEPIIKIAEKHNIQIVMELLNSKVDHKNYQCDNTAWGVSLVEKIGSPNFKLLYDIYHMQIMEGNIISTIQQNSKYISHYHTGGVPGRNEVNESQELNYRRIIKAIMDTGYDGYIAQEFIPKRVDKIFSLKEGIEICDI